MAARKFEYIKFSKFNWENVNIDLQIQVHSFSEFLKAFLPEMSKNKYGKIVVMLSSVTKGLPPKYLTQYTTVKYALMGLLNSLVSEYKEKGININAVSPTMVETNFLENIDSRLIELNAMNSGMKRNIKPIEVASAIDYLMRDDSEYVNGLNLGITGGDII
jgi:3-oxoacyl-[acyl-carrier protein] reductase